MRILLTVLLSGCWFLVTCQETDLNAVGTQNVEVSISDSMEQHGLKEKILTGWQFGLENFYASGVTQSYFGEGVFSNLNIGKQMEVRGFPMRLTGSLVVQNNELNRRLSTVSFSFDHQKFLANQKARIENRLRDFSKSQLSESDIKILEKEEEWVATYHAALHEKLEEKRQVLEDSIKEIQNRMWEEVADFKDAADSIRQSEEKKIKDSTDLARFENALTKVRAAEKKQDSLRQDWAKKVEQVQEVKKRWEQKVAKHKKELESLKNGEEMEGFARSKIPLGRAERLLLSLRKFAVGSFRLTDSPLNASGVPLNGLNLEAKRGQYFLAVAVGKEGRQQRRLPDYVRNFRLAGEGRKVAHFKTGIGSPEESHLHFSFAGVSVGAGVGADSVAAIAPKKNVVLGLDSRYQISKSFYLEGISALSSSDFTGKTRNQELLRGIYPSQSPLQNGALLGRIGWKSENGKSGLSVGYQSVGAQFVALGNLFLLSGRNALRMEGKQSIGKERLIFKTTYLKTLSNGAATNLHPSLKQDQFSGEVSWRVGKRGSRIWANYSPAQYLQKVAGVSEQAVYQLNLVTIGTQVAWAAGKKAKGRWMTMAQLTNFADQSQFGDSSTTTGLWYCFLTQTYTSEKYLFNMLLNSGVDAQNLNSVRDFTGEVSQSIFLKKWQLTQGLQAVRRFYEPGLFGGFSLGCQFLSSKKLRLGLNGTWLNNLTEEGSPQFFFNSSLGFQF